MRRTWKPPHVVDFWPSGAALAVPFATRAASAAPGAAARAGLAEPARSPSIYGAAGAIGSAVSRAFAREGAQLVPRGPHSRQARSAGRRVDAAGGSAHRRRASMRSIATPSKNISTTSCAPPARIDISFNLIGLGGEQGQSLTAMTREAFDVPIDNAMRTHFLTATAAARHMAKRGARRDSRADRAGRAQALRGQRRIRRGLRGHRRVVPPARHRAGPERNPRVTLRSSGSPDAPALRPRLPNTPRPPA